MKSIRSSRSSRAFSAHVWLANRTVHRRSAGDGLPLQSMAPIAQAAHSPTFFISMRKQPACPEKHPPRRANPDGFPQHIEHIRIELFALGR